MFTLPIFSLPLYSAANSSRIGVTILHGPHHSAQKSTSTGVADLITSGSKLEPVNVTIFSAAINYRVAARVGPRTLPLLQLQKHEQAAHRPKTNYGGRDRQTKIQSADTTRCRWRRRPWRSGRWRGSRSTLGRTSHARGRRSRGWRWRSGAG